MSDSVKKFYVENKPMCDYAMIMIAMSASIAIIKKVLK